MPSLPVDLTPQTRRLLIATALDLFSRNGYAETSIADIAAAAKVDLDVVFRLFGRKETFILSLYQRLSVELESRSVELPHGTLAERFSMAMNLKLDLVQPHCNLLTKLLPAAISFEDRVGALSEHTERIRAQVLSVFRLVVEGATDCPDAPTAAALSRSLYGFHLALLLMFLLEPTGGRAARGATQLLSDLLALIGPAINDSDLAKAIVGGVDHLIGPLVQPPSDAAHFSRAENVLRLVFRHRRLLADGTCCETHPCRQCFALHLPKVERFIRRDEPIHFLLPAFPAKSANRSKTLGALPDLGEELSLRFLHGLTEEIKQFHEAGARVTICSDGRVFGDLVGVTDDNVSAYGRDLATMIDTIGADRIDLFDLDDVFRSANHADARERLIRQYAEPLPVVVERAKRVEHHRAMFNGIHRFVFEDQIELRPELSRTQVRKQAKQIAYEVIRRSNAWSRLVAECFPDALRLSIHPQYPHSDKIGILLTHAEDQWITPWHGCILLDDKQYTLVRRSKAEELGAELIEKQGRASHFQMPCEEQPL